MVAFPVIVKKLVSYFVFLPKTELDSDKWKVRWLGHDGLFEGTYDAMQILVALSIEHENRSRASSYIYKI